MSTSDRADNRYLELSRLLDGECDIEASIREEIEMDAELAAEWEAFEATDALLEEAYAPGTHPFDDRFVESVMAEIPSRKAPVHAFPGWAKVVTAVAATLLVAATVFFWGGAAAPDGRTHRGGTDGNVARLTVDGGSVQIDRRGDVFWPAGDSVELRDGDAVQNRSHRTIQLETADGSLVAISGGAQIRVREGRGTTIELVGEGRVFCDVAKQKAGRTFRVRTDEMDVAVVGTRFLVEHVNGRSRAGVLEGKVACSGRRGGRRVLIGRFQQARFDESGELWTEPNDTILTELRWVPDFDLLVAEESERAEPADPTTNSGDPEDPRDPTYRPGGVKDIDGSMDGPVTPPEKD